jgi:hypothetical protein
MSARSTVPSSKRATTRLPSYSIRAVRLSMDGGPAEMNSLYESMTRSAVISRDEYEHPKTLRLLLPMG